VETFGEARKFLFARRFRRDICALFHPLTSFAVIAGCHADMNTNAYLPRTKFACVEHPQHLW
jgi:hypothetical protein